MPSKQILDRIVKANQKFNIFTSIRNDIPAATPGLALSGMLVAVKDNIVTTQEPTTCSSKTLANYISPFDSTVTTLLEGNGARIVGKTNLDEFGMGSACTHSIFGPTTNPLYPNEKRISGGSSGGSAAAVAADVVDFSIGTDTGGSVRLPAAYCGVIGFKPTYGRISRWGVIAYSQSLDTVGIFSKKIDTVKKVFGVLDKYDPSDPTSLKEGIRDKFIKKRSAQTLKFGVIEQFNLEEISQETREAWRSFLTTVIQSGHEVVQISSPIIKYALPAYYTLAPAEASSNLARYDGIRYGHRSSVADSKDGVQFAPTRNEGFGDEVKSRILMGTYNLSSEAYNNNFIKAQKIRQRICDEFDKIFNTINISPSNEANVHGVDFIISPTSMTTAPLLESVLNNDNEDPIKSYVNDVLTVPASLAGLPAITVPWNYEGGEVPIGIQIIGQFGDDDAVLDIAEELLK